MMRSLAPCENFGTCTEARWSPTSGHIPRGYVGAFARAEDVQLIVVFAEPGDPHEGESYSDDLAPDALIESPLNHAYLSFRDGRDQFHRNLRWFLDQVFPGLSFDQQLRHTWLTEGRLCSFDAELGGRRDFICAQTFLSAQVAMMPNAFVVTAGTKASDYVRRLGIPHQSCYAFAPPGANHRPAKPSWERAIEQVRRHIDRLS